VGYQGAVGEEGRGAWSGKQRLANAVPKQMKDAYYPYDCRLSNREMKVHPLIRKLTLDTRHDTQEI